MRALSPKFEGCLVIEGGGIVLYPPHEADTYFAQFQPRDGECADSLTRAEAEARILGDDPTVLSHTVLMAAESEDDWVEELCASLASHRDFHVRRNALFALGRLAHKKRPLNRESIQPIIERAMVDPNSYVAGQAANAAMVVEGDLRWVINAFDNGQPELEVTTYSNGWIKCPNCGWRYATYDPSAFREGRCMQCRQKLRVIPGAT